MVSDIDSRELNLSWNSQYQLISVDSVDSNEVGGKVSYDYNVLGQRVARSVVAAGVTNVEYYVHNGVNIVADLDSDKNLLRSYSYALGYDNIISMTSYGDTDTNTYFYIRNHNNSVVALIDENGDISESYDYDAYGAVTVFDTNGNELDESALGNRYTFQGREIDWSTGLYNFRARYYDPKTGRWLSKDPIGISGGLNQYVFCGNNPVMFGDPEGLDVWDWHYEWRDAGNGKHPTYDEVKDNPDWRLLSPDLSKYHDNHRGKCELKFINDDGREAVFDGDTLEPMTDPRYKGTFNYFTPAPTPRNRLNIIGWEKVAFYGFGHFVFDMLPYYAVGNKNERNQDEFNDHKEE